MTNKSCFGQKSDQTDIQVEKRSIRGSCTITSSTRYVLAKALYGFKTAKQRVLGLFSHSSTQNGQPDQVDIASKTNDRERSKSIIIFEESEQERKTQCMLRAACGCFLIGWIGMIIAWRYIAVLRIVLALRHTTDVGSSVSVIVTLQSSVSAIHRIFWESGIHNPGLNFKSLESQLCSIVPHH